MGFTTCKTSASPFSSSKKKGNTNRVSGLPEIRQEAHQTSNFHSDSNCHLESALVTEAART